MLNKLIKYIGVFVALFLLICIRFFEEDLFYDPFLQFFKSEYQNKPLPDFDEFKLIVNVVLRYFLNAIFSVLILYFLFKNNTHIKVAVFFYLFLLVFLLLVFAYLLFFSENPNYLLLFYVRRFLIQPLFILLLIPAFYFQKKAE